MKKLHLTKITKKLDFSTKINKINIIKNKKKLILIKNILKKNKKSIIESIVKDVKKSKKDAENEFIGSLKIWDYVIRNINSIQKNKKIKFNNADRGEIIYKPIGLVAFITPWNYPLLTLSERLPFCLATGSTAIIKQSEYSQNFKNVLLKIFNHKREIVDTLHILKNTSYKTGIALCSDENISAINFIGSSETGRKILMQTSSTLKKTFLELGGKNAAIITNKANLKLSVDEIIKGIFENGGQACVGISRLIIHKNIIKDFLKQLKNAIEKNYKYRNFFIQKPANKQQQQKILKVMNYINKNYKNKIFKKFNLGLNKYTPIFLKPNICDSYFLDNEFFFPIITIQTFKKLNEAVKINNQSKFGLAAYIFTKDIDELRTLSYQLNSGRIWHNSSLIWDPSLPVGGFKLSGQDRDMGQKGFENYMISKSIYKKKLYFNKSL